MKVDISKFVNNAKFNRNVTASDGKEQYQSQMKNQPKVNYVINVVEKKTPRVSVKKDSVVETPATDNENVNFRKSLNTMDIFSKHIGYFRNKESLEKYYEIVEDRLIKIIDQDEDILTMPIKEGSKRVLGDFALELGMYRVVDRILDSYSAATYQDDNGRNLGMKVAHIGLKDLTMKALDNHDASIQQDDEGRNIGMVAMYRCNSIEPKLKALDNYDAAIQQDYCGYNMGMIAATKSTKRFRNDEVVLKALDNPVASVQKNYYGQNIGMLATFGCDEIVVMKALRNQEAALQQDFSGNNIGMYAGQQKRMINAVLLAMENEEAMKQVGYKGNTILTYSMVSEKNGDSVIFKIPNGANYVTFEEQINFDKRKLEEKYTRTSRTAKDETDLLEVSIEELDSVSDLNEEEYEAFLKNRNKTIRQRADELGKDSTQSDVVDKYRKYFTASNQAVKQTENQIIDEMVDQYGEEEVSKAIADVLTNTKVDDFSLDKCVSDFCSNFDTEMSE